MSRVICTQNSTARAMPAESLGELARGVFGQDRVDVTPASRRRHRGGDRDGGGRRQRRLRARERGSPRRPAPSSPPERHGPCSWAGTDALATSDDVRVRARLRERRAGVGHSGPDQHRGHVDRPRAVHRPRALAVSAIVVAGLLRHEWAYYLGFAIQAAAIALTIVVPAMIVLGLIFGALWTTAYVLGRKIEAQRPRRPTARRRAFQVGYAVRAVRR